MLKKVKENMGNIIVCILEVVIGILLLIKPVGFTSGIIILFGVAAIILGILEVVKYFKMDACVAAEGQNLVKGMVYILAGAFCILKSKWFIATFPLLTILYGTANLINGFFKIQISVDLVRMNRNDWKWPACSAALTTVFSIIILANPFTSTAVLWTFVSVALILEAVCDMVSIFISNREKQN